MYAERYMCNQDIFKEHLIKESQQTKKMIYFFLLIFIGG